MPVKAALPAGKLRHGHDYAPHAVVEFDCEHTGAATAPKGHISISGANWDRQKALALRTYTASDRYRSYREQVPSRNTK